VAISDSSAPPRFYRFDGFTVDAGRRLLLRGNAALPLTSKAFDLLLALVESRGELLTKQELLARVWPNQIVEEGNLTVHISAIRKALGERRGEHRFVVTVPGWGYRFVADVRDGDDDVESPPAVVPMLDTPAPRRAATWRALAAALAVVAVLSAALLRRAPAAPRATMSTRLLTALGDVSSAVLSHDGEWFAYVTARDGMESLWLRRVRGTEPPRQLRPPEDLDYQGFAFTPDDARLLYAAHDTLYALSLREAPSSVPVAVVGHVRGAFALSPDGARVAFVRRAPDRSRTTLVVATLGGADAGRQREVAVLAAPREFSPYGPAWSPDGAALVVGATSAAAPDKFVLTRVRVADGALTPLGGGAWDEVNRVAWLRDGVVAFNAVGAGSDFHVWLLDLATGALRCVTPDLSRYGRASVSVTDDGRALLAVRDEVNSTVWVSRSPDGADARPVTRRAFGKLDGSAGLTWTPDGRLVYVSFVNGSYALWSMAADGGDAKPLTGAGYMDRFPHATADGRAIVFESNRGGGADIWRVDRDGARLRPLTVGGHAAQPALTPDGRWVLYTRVGDGAPSIWRVSIDGGASERVTPDGSSWPSVSPDGTRLAYGASDSVGGANPTRLVVRALADGRAVAEFPVASGGRLTNGLQWTPDGAAVVYRDQEHGVWRQALGGGAAARVLDATAGRIYFVDWARDGRRLAVSYVDEVRDVVLMSGFR